MLTLTIGWQGGACGSIYLADLQDRGGIQPLGVRHGGDAEGDMLYSIEQIWDSHHDDKIVGSTGSEWSDGNGNIITLTGVDVAVIGQSDFVF